MANDEITSEKTGLTISHPSLEEARTTEAKWLSRAVASIGEGVMITNAELDWPGPQTVFVNEAMCRITGYPADELIGQTPRILQGAKTDREAMAALKQRLAAGHSAQCEVVNYRKDGTPYYAELYVSPVRASDGNMTHFVSIHRDVSARRHVEETLRRERELNEAVVNAAPNIVLLLDKTGRILRFNPYMERLTGWRLSEAQGRDWFDTFLPAADRERIRRLFAEAISGRRTRANLNAIVTRDGQQREIEWYDEPLTAADGELIGMVCIGRDVTEQKQVMKALSESEKRMSLAVQATRDGIWDCDLVRGTVWWNDRYNELFGERPSYTQDSWRWWIDHIHPDDRQRVSDSVQETIDGDTEYWSAEYRYRRTSGGYAHVLDRAYLLRDDQGRATRMLGAMTDITQIKRAEEEARSREEQLRAILNAAPDAIISIDARGTILDANPAARRIFGYREGELIGQNVSLLMPSPYREDHHHYVARYFETRQPRMIGLGRELQAKAKDGRVFPIELAVSEIDHSQTFIGIVRDITDRKALERQVVDATAEAQRRIGQDIHDGVGQELAGLRYMAQTHAESLADQTISSDTKTAERMSQWLETIQRQLRGIIRELVPVEVDGKGLVVALDELAKRTAETYGLDCTFACKPLVSIQDNALATHLYRIAQEAVGNAVRHARAQRITVRLEEKPDALRLLIVDDGIGIQSLPTPVEQRGIGLRSMAYRTGLVGGGFRIEKSEGGGTTVTCTVPWISAQQ